MKYTRGGRAARVVLFRIRMFSGMLLCVLPGIFCLCGAVTGTEAASQQKAVCTVEALRTRIAEEGVILHGAGELTDTEGSPALRTNSVEALTHCLEEGSHFIELDLKSTADGKLVCLHGWSRWLDAQGVEGQESHTLEEFLAGSIVGGFTPMSMDEAAQLLRAYPDVYVIVDMKDSSKEEDYQLLAESCPDLMGRLIVQIYHASQYETLRDMGYSNIIYTLYKTMEEERTPEELREFCDSHLIVGIALKRKWAADEAYFEALRQLNIPLYVHTLDDPEKIRRLYERGAAAVYTNHFFSREDIAAALQESLTQEETSS